MVYSLDLNNLLRKLHPKSTKFSITISRNNTDMENFIVVYLKLTNVMKTLHNPQKDQLRFKLAV